MRAFTEPLVRLREAMHWFVAAREQRLLDVRTEPNLRNGLLEVIAAMEEHSRNDSPFLFLEAPSDGTDSSWDLRAEELREVYTELRGAPGNAELMLTELPAVNSTIGGLARFGAELAQVSKAIASNRLFGGLVVVLAPIENTDEVRWQDDLSLLMGQSHLQNVRWIVVDAEDRGIAGLATRLGEGAVSLRCTVDDDLLARDRADLVAALKSAPGGAVGPRALGAAGPSLGAPPRPGGTESAAGEVGKQLLDARVQPALADPTVGRAVAIAVLSAADAASNAKPKEAVTHQQEAVRISREAGLEQQAISMELMLGGYLIQASAFDVAGRLFGEAAKRAAAGAFYDLEVQAAIAGASCLLLSKRWFDASLAYAQAGTVGVQHGASMLAIEAFRMSGQLLAEHGEEERAAKMWRRALEVGEASVAVAARSSAPLAARQLAKMCRERGLSAQADSLEQQAQRLESSADEAVNQLEMA